MSLEREFENEMARLRMMNSALDAIFGPISLDEPLIGVGDLPQDVQAGVERDRDTGIGTKTHENAELTTEPCNGSDPEGGVCWRRAVEVCLVCEGYFCEPCLQDHDCPGIPEE